MSPLAPFRQSNVATLAWAVFFLIDYIVANNIGFSLCAPVFLLYALFMGVIAAVKFYNGWRDSVKPVAASYQPMEIEQSMSSPDSHELFVPDPLPKK